MEEADDGEWIRIRVGATKSSTLRNIYSAVDEHYTSRPITDVQSEGDEGDEDTDIRTDSSITTGADAGTVDGGLEGDANNSGESDAPIESLGTKIDAGAGPDPDNTQEPTSGADVDPSPTQRVEQTGRPASRKYAYFVFLFAPGALHTSEFL
jgi:hypothetical protein